MNARSARAEVRNPVLALPAFRALQSLLPEQRVLLAALIAECEAKGYRQMIAVIGDSGTASSIGLHRALGFTFCGVIHSVGFKHGRWLDSVLMQRPLGTGDTTPAA